MTALTLIRHGETDWNRAGRIQGSTDIPLNETGRKQAQDAAAALRDDLEASARLVLASSDLSRAHETAAIIAAALGAPDPALYPQLRERAYGEAEGLHVDEFRSRWGDWHTAQIPGAETRAQLRERALAGLRQARHDAAEAMSGGGLLVVVAHGALIREVIGHASDDLLPEPGTRLLNGSAHRFRFTAATGTAAERLHLLTSAVTVA